ncbi:MAG TPA: hypothetical protein VIT19_04905 [Pyrinomonadaceae bacterium]
MKRSESYRKTRGFVILVALLALAALPLISSARTAATSVNIVNDSSREIQNVYISHVNANDWSGNLLGAATIPAGQSFTLNNVACDQQQVRVIAEDADGCFLSTVVACGDSAVWTVTNASTRDCGNQD